MKKLLITALLGTALFNGFNAQDNETIVKGINAAAPEKITENTKAKAPEEIEQKEENVLCFYSVEEEFKPIVTENLTEKKTENQEQEPQKIDQEEPQEQEENQDLNDDLLSEIMKYLPQGTTLFNLDKTENLDFILNDGNYASYHLGTMENTTYYEGVEIEPGKEVVTVILYEQGTTSEIDRYDYEYIK